MTTCLFYDISWVLYQFLLHHQDFAKQSLTQKVLKIYFREVQKKKITENSGFTDSIHVMVAICEVYGTILINSLVATVYVIRKIM